MINSDWLKTAKNLLQRMISSPSTLRNLGYAEQAVGTALCVAGVLPISTGDEVGVPVGAMCTIIGAGLIFLGQIARHTAKRLTL